MATAAPYPSFEAERVRHRAEARPLAKGGVLLHLDRQSTIVSRCSRAFFVYRGDLFERGSRFGKSWYPPERVPQPERDFSIEIPGQVYRLLTDSAHSGCSKRRRQDGQG